MINNAISGSDLQNMNFLNVITRIKDVVRFVSFTPDFSQVTSGARMLGGNRLNGLLRIAGDFHLAEAR